MRMIHSVVIHEKPPSKRPRKQSKEIALCFLGNFHSFSLSNIEVHEMVYFQILFLKYFLFVIIPQQLVRSFIFI